MAHGGAGGVLSASGQAAASEFFSASMAWSCLSSIVDLVLRLLAALPSTASERFHGDRNHPVRFETKLALQFLKRGRGTERLHADDAAGGAHITVPAENRALLDGDARRYRGWQHLVPIGLWLIFENVP